MSKVKFKPSNLPKLLTGTALGLILADVTLTVACLANGFKELNPFSEILRSPFFFLLKVFGGDLNGK